MGTQEREKIFLWQNFSAVINPFFYVNHIHINFPSAPGELDMNYVDTFLFIISRKFSYGFIFYSFFLAFGPKNIYAV
jgi:hypothetical protein